jgi:hypothetical protein
MHWKSKELLEEARLRYKHNRLRVWEQRMETVRTIAWVSLTFLAAMFMLSIIVGVFLSIMGVV